MKARTVFHTGSEARAPSALVPALWLALLFSFANCGYAWDYGNGRHGSYVLTTNATIEQLYQTVRLPADPAQYNPADSNAVPNFQNLTITNGATLTANPWDGISGGLLALKVRDALNVASDSTISVSGKGYRGGDSNQQGESYAGSQLISYFSNYGGGGGAPSTYFTTSGGGGGYGAVGASGLGGVSGGGIYGVPSLDTVFLGSGGGGGISGIGYTVHGGNGGGAILLQAASLQADGRIQADGGHGADGSYGSGGGGAGGSILLRVAFAVLGTNNLTAIGGIGGATTYPPNPGGSGGVGRIMIGYAESYTGATTPTAYIFNDTNSDTINITNQPNSQSLFLGSNVLFNVGFSTLSPYTLQWYFNGTAIPGATNQSLSLFNLSLTNQGNYWLTISNVVMTVNSSNIYLFVLDTNDPTGGIIPNWWKEEYGLSTNNPTLPTNYPSGDKLTYLQKYLYGLNPLTNDTDGDGLTDYDEIFVYHTNPLLADTDGDGIPDGWEVQHGLNPLVNDASQIGPDGVSNLQIYQYDLMHTNQVDQLDPHNPFFAPGTSIYEVLNNGQHTNRFYYDHEDRLVGAEYSRCISLAYTYDGNSNLKRQTVLSRANETNGLPVLWQFLNGLTNGTAADGSYGDADGDGWNNYQEWLAGTNPRDAQSTPNLLGNPGINIASLTLPFTPSNFVVGVGQLDGLGAEEIVIGADGNPGTNVNWLLVLTETTGGWSTQRVDVGTFGITSVAVGQVTNRPNAGIYVGLRGTTNGSGRVMEFTSNGGIWQSNVVALSTNQAAFVLGVPGQNILVSLATTNAADGALHSATFSSNAWSSVLVNTNTSHRGLGITAMTGGNDTTGRGLRLLDSGGLEIGGFYSGSAPTNQGLVAWYPFNGNADDLSGNGHNGLISGASQTTDRFNNPGRAYAFNGTNTWIDVAGISFANQSFSMTTWVQRKMGAAGNFDCVFGYGDNTGTDFERRLHVGFRATSEFTFAFYADDLNTAPLSDYQEWHFLGADVRRCNTCT